MPRPHAELDHAACVMCMMTGSATSGTAGRVYLQKTHDPSGGVAWKVGRAAKHQVESAVLHQLRGHVHLTHPLCRPPQMPDEMFLKPFTGLPNTSYPSDHLALVVGFRFKKTDAFTTGLPWDKVAGDGEAEAAPEEDEELKVCGTCYCRVRVRIRRSQTNQVACHATKQSAQQTADGICKSRARSRTEGQTVADALYARLTSCACFENWSFTVWFAPSDVV